MSKGAFYHHFPSKQALFVALLNRWLDEIDLQFERVTERAGGVSLGLQRMAEQQTEDPTWGRTVSSAHFACQAFTSVGWSEEAQQSLEFIRSCYAIENGALVVDLSNLSTLVDFDEIHGRLKKEEEEGGFPAQFGLERSETIDMSRFHANWIAGLVGLINIDRSFIMC